jgi:hypothetical protein
MDQLSKSYQTLGLEVGASQEQVKQAYRDLVNVWHPDRFSHDKRLRLVAQEKMKEINGAHEFLKASFFEAGIASAANATYEAEVPNTEPDEEISKTKGNRGATWLVLGFLFLVLIGAAFFLLGERRSKKVANPQPTDNASAISQMNKPADLATNSVRVSEAINSPTLPLASHALAFDGDKSYVKVNTTGSLTGIFTVECWALSEQTGAVGILVSSRGPKDYSFDMKFGGDGIDGDIGDGANWLTTKADVPFKYLPDTWYHIAYVVTPGHYMIYINGVLSASKDDSPGNPVLYDTDHPMITMGMLYPDNESLKGFISEVKIWKTARSQAQVQADMSWQRAGTEPGLQGYWRFNDGTGKIAADSSGHGFSGTLIGNVRWTTNVPPQIAGPLGIGNGLTPVANEDGIFTISERSGVHCWLVAKGKPHDNYFYLKVDRHFRVQPGDKLEIDLTYFDEGSGDIALDYDSTDSQLPDAGAFKRPLNVIHRINSGQWKLARFYVNDAHFAHRENGRTDFRFYNGGDALLISAVQVLRK